MTLLFLPREDSQGMNLPSWISILDHPQPSSRFTYQLEEHKCMQYVTVQYFYSCHWTEGNAGAQFGW